MEAAISSKLDCIISHRIHLQKIIRLFQYLSVKGVGLNFQRELLKT